MPIVSHGGRRRGGGRSRSIGKNMTEWAHTESTGGDEIIEHPECSRKAHNHYQYGVDEQKKPHTTLSLSLPQTECSRNPIALFSFHASLKRQKQKTRIVSPDSVKDPTLSLVVGMCVGLSTFSRYLNNRYRVQDSTKTKTRDVLIHAWKSVPSTRGRIWFLQSRVIDHPSAVGRKKREGGEQPTGQWQITATEIGKKEAKGHSSHNWVYNNYRLGSTNCILARWEHGKNRVLSRWPIFQQNFKPFQSGGRLYLATVTRDNT